MRRVSLDRSSGAVLERTGSTGFLPRQMCARTSSSSWPQVCSARRLCRSMAVSTPDHCAWLDAP